MKMHNKMALVAATLVVLTVFSSISTVLATTTLPSREKVMWATGFDNDPTNLNPWTRSPGYAVAFMYMPLFGWNAKTSKLIPAIGTEYAFDTTGKTVTISLNDKAKWSDGKKITAADVVFSITAAMNTSAYSEIKDRVEKVEDVEGKVVMTMKDAYKNSLNVKKWLTTDLLVIPKHVWETILEDEGDTYANNWFDEDYPYAKVSSGPYVPFYLDKTGNVEIEKKVDNWWGDGEIYQDIPAIVNDVTGKNASFVAPEYIGSKTGLTNTGKMAAMISGGVDLMSGAVTDIAALVKDEKNVETFYGKGNTSYFLPGGGVITVSINQQYVAPTGVAAYVPAQLKNIAIREALAWAIDYDRVNIEGNAGNWVRARQGIIDDRCSSMAEYYNASIQAKYGVSYNVWKAVEVLIAAGCTFTNATNTTLNAGQVSSTSASAWEDANGDPIGPFEIFSETGWTDVAIAADVWCESWQLLGIPVIHKYVSWDDYQKTFVQANDYQMLMDCITPQMTNDIMTVLQGYQGNADKTIFDRNTTRWINANFADAYAKFETASEADRMKYASIMQEELAKNYVWIPVMVNALWLTYNTKYWTGFTKDAGTDAFQQPVSASTTAMVAVKQRLVLNLRSTAVEESLEPTSGAIPFAGLSFAIGVAFVAVSLITVKKLRKNE